MPRPRTDLIPPITQAHPTRAGGAAFAAQQGKRFRARPAPAGKARLPRRAAFHRLPGRGNASAIDLVVVAVNHAHVHHTWPRPTKAVALAGHFQGRAGVEGAAKGFPQGCPAS